MKLDSYKIQRLLSVINYLDNPKNNGSTADDIAAAAFYSYRNINRIFKTYFNKSIGKYHKEKLLEEGAKKLVYTDQSISSIAISLGYNDLQAFNKAFKKNYDLSPAQFRTEKRQSFQQELEKIMEERGTEINSLTYERLTLPSFKAICIPIYGVYSDEKINAAFETLEHFAKQHELLNEQTIFFGEIKEEEAITKAENIRYTAGVILSDFPKVEPENFIQYQVYAGGQYVSFLHQGNRDNIDKTYENIFAHWLMKNEFELVDGSFLQLYINDEADTPIENLETLLYLPIQDENSQLNPLPE